MNYLLNTLKMNKQKWKHPEMKRWLEFKRGVMNQECPKLNNVFQEPDIKWYNFFLIQINPCVKSAQNIPKPALSLTQES